MKPKTFEQVYAILPQGWLSEAEARLLWEWVAPCPPDGLILEVGCYRGRSSVLLASTGRFLHAVDPFAGFDSDDVSGAVTKRLWERAMVERGFVNYTLHCQGIEDFNPFGFAYWFAHLDGDHTYQGTQVQIAQALRAGVKRISVHDVNDTGGGVEVKRACLEQLGPWARRVERLAVWEVK